MTVTVVSVLDDFITTSAGEFKKGKIGGNGRLLWGPSEGH